MVRSGFVVVLLAVGILAGCREENVLYQVESPDWIPPVPAEHPTGVHVSPNAGPHTGAILPDPREATFKAPEIDEPVVEVRLRGVAFPLPVRYEPMPNDSGMRAALYQVPSPDGEASETELTIFHFGRGQGGGMRDNAERWLKQFKAPEGAETPLQRFQTGRVGSLEVTRMTLEGTYTATAMMAGAPPQARENWALDALIIEGGPEGALYFRMAGPVHEVHREGGILELIAAKIEVDAQHDPHAGHDHAIEGPHEVKQPVEPEDTVIGLSRVEAPGVAFAVPASWQETQTTSSMRALQFNVPGAGGPAELVVFYFGPEGGGPVGENVQRWISQVAQADGSDSREQAEIHSAEHGPFKLTTVYVEGTYGGTPMMPGAPAPEAQANQGFFGMIVEGGKEGPLYIRLTGPVETVRETRPIMANVAGTLEEN